MTASIAPNAAHILVEHMLRDFCPSGEPVLSQRQCKSSGFTTSSKNSRITISMTTLLLCPCDLVASFLVEKNTLGKLCGKLDIGKPWSPRVVLKLVTQCKSLRPKCGILRQPPYDGIE